MDRRTFLKWSVAISAGALLPMPEVTRGEETAKRAREPWIFLTENPVQLFRYEDNKHLIPVMETREIRYETIDSYVIHHDYIDVSPRWFSWIYNDDFTIYIVHSPQETDMLRDGDTAEQDAMYEPIIAQVEALLGMV